MAKYFNHVGKEVPIFHFQGKSRYKYQNIINELQENKVIIPNNISIITFCNEINLPYSPLIKQLEKSGIPYLNPALNIIEWKDTLKIKLLLQVIDEIETEYVLVLDSLDVVFNEKVEELLDRFAEYDKRILFGATQNNCPEEIVDIVENRDWLGDFKYLNAGTVLGRPSDVKAFYEKAYDLLDKVENPDENEQLLIRMVFDGMQDLVGFDYKCDCFQTFSQAIVKAWKDENSWIIRGGGNE